MIQTGIRVAAPSGRPVSERLFGCNLEPTRRTSWSGLSAQMINNRKFYALTDTGFAGFESAGSVAIGADRSRSVCGSTYPIVTDGSLTQRSRELTALRGRSYRLRLWSENGTDARITVRWGEAFSRSFSLPGKPEPRLTEATFEAKAEGEQPFTLAVEGTAALYCVSLTPADAFYGMRREAVEELKKLRISFLRFPGGCYAEAYDWKQGLLPPDRRPPVATDLYDGDFLQRNTYGYECHETGTDEFMALCREIGAAPALTVPIIGQDPQNAADWAEYCLGGGETRYGALRIARGHAAPYPVKVWFIGNEVYFFGRELAEDGERAGGRELEFLRAIKRIDPAAETVAGCSPYRPEWSRASLQRCGGASDLFSHHFYFTNEFADNADSFTAEEALQVAEPFLADLRETLALVEGCGVKDPAVSIDEWGFDWGNRGSTLSAVTDGLILMEILRWEQRYRIREACYFHPVNEGLIRVEPDRAEPDLFGELWPLFRAHAGEVPAETETGDGGIAAVATAADRTRLTLINRDLRQAREVTVPGRRILRAEVFTPAALTLTCRSMERRRLEEPAAVTLAPGAVAQLICE